MTALWQPPRRPETSGRSGPVTVTDSIGKILRVILDPPSRGFDLDPSYLESINQSRKRSADKQRKGRGPALRLRYRSRPEEPR